MQNLCNAGSRIHSIARHFFEKEFKAKLDISPGRSASKAYRIDPFVTPWMLSLNILLQRRKNKTGQPFRLRFAPCEDAILRGHKPTDGVSHQFFHPDPIRPIPFRGPTMRCWIYRPWRKVSSVAQYIVARNNARSMRAAMTAAATEMRQSLTVDAVLKVAGGGWQWRQDGVCYQCQISLQNSR